MTADLCPQSDIDAIVALLDQDEAAGLSALSALARAWPLDARLPFLEGSVLAGARRYDEAKAAMTRAVDIAPGFDLARFQLGFLGYTSGDAAGASAVWGPLKALAETHPLRAFAEGLEAIAEDRTPEGVKRIEAGMAANDFNPPLNRDMGMLIAELRRAGLDDGSAAEETVSETQFLLNQSLFRR
ncbi:tetratricopeptide repeat protein [Brevundimonas faecalis]|uniref:tetratricopeptide repeat protein n=1 Tax=Brevundimonas faecalis TaxID=947378 RepID=UPI00361B7A51